MAGGNMNKVPKVDKPGRSSQKKIPQPGTGKGAPGAYPFGPGKVSTSKGDTGGTTKKPGVNSGKKK